MFLYGSKYGHIMRKYDRIFQIISYLVHNKENKSNIACKPLQMYPWCNTIIGLV